MSSHSYPCYNCEKRDDGPICKRCWKNTSNERRELIKLDFNKNVPRGTHGADAQLFCDVPGCWNIVKKKLTADGKCFEHVDVVDDHRRADRSRSPVRRGVASASTHAPRMIEAIVRLRAGLEMMQNAINEIDDVARSA